LDPIYDLKFIYRDISQLGPQNVKSITVCMTLLSSTYFRLRARLRRHNLLISSNISQKAKPHKTIRKKMKY